MLKFLKEFFNLSSKELRGVLWLLFLVLLFFIGPKLYYKYKAAQTTDDTKEFAQWIAEIEAQQTKSNELDGKQKVAENNTKEKFPFDFNTVSYAEMMQLGIDGKTANILLKYRNKGARFYSKKDVLRIYGFTQAKYEALEEYVRFPQKEKDESVEEKNIEIINPNTATWKEWVAIGLDSKTANILIKFRNKGAIFYAKEDLLKVYGFTEEKYNQLESFLVFPERPQETKVEKNPSENTEIPTLYIVDVNKADTSDFKKLKGIGSYYAKQIVNYRTRLGGFYSIAQLKEVYRLKAELYTQIEPNLILEQAEVKKIDLNHTSFKELIRHPYIDKQKTIEILKLQKDLGGFLSITDLKSYAVFSEKEFEKIKHYIVVSKK